MNKLLLLGLCILLVPLVNAVNDYSDVLIVTNNESALSINITNYFISQRINVVNVMNISTPATETITFATFNTSIRAPIETWLINNNKTQTINYIILTKGVPLRVSSPARSVDSMLNVILSRYNSTIGTETGTGFLHSVNNPMYNQNYSANKSRYDIYVVTRLDGYTQADIYASIIKAGAQSNLSGRFLLDRKPSKTGGYLAWDVLMDLAYTELSTSGYTVYFENTSTFITNVNNISGYYSWGSNDGAASANSSTWNITFNNGAIGDTAVSTSGRSLNTGTVYGQSLIADLIHSNISLVKGYVYEPYLIAISNPAIVVDRYDSGFFGADSLYMGSQLINWQDIYVGDPKVRAYNTTVIIPEVINNTVIINITNTTQLCSTNYKGVIKKYTCTASSGKCVYYNTTCEPDNSTESNKKYNCKRGNTCVEED